jgi:rhodanese-related sulfurtransferase
LFVVHHARPDALRAVRAEHGLGFQLLYDILAWSSRTWHQAGRRPYVRDGFAVVRNGRIVQHAIGPVHPDEIAAALGTGTVEASTETGNAIDWARVDARIHEGFLLLDVRTPDEFGALHHPAARNIPLDELPTRFGELGGSKRIIAVCQTGGRSENAVGFLRSSGVSDAYSVRGGMNAWAGKA